MSPVPHEPFEDSLPPIVLLVETDTDTLQSHSQFLEASGMWVATATDPAHGLSCVRELRPNLVVTDVTFAGQPTGGDLVHAIKQDNRTSHVPVVVLISTPIERVAPEAQREADLVLVKPVVPELLFRRGRALIEASARLRERFNTAMERSYRLVSENAAACARVRRNVEKLQHLSRLCPQCGVPLRWLERGTISGVEYDYYRWCVNGCGLFCYDRTARDWVKLV